MADDNIIIRSRLETDISQTEKRIQWLEQKLKDAMKIGDLGGIDNVDRALDQAKQKLADLKKQLDDVNKKIDDSGKETKTFANELSAADKVAGGLAKTMGALFSVHMAKEFVTRIAQTRGEFQQLEIAFETMLGNKEKADRLMADAVKLAAKTPFDLQGVAAGAKSLLAFGMDSEKVIDTLRRLGDVSAGLSLPLGRLTTIFGQTMVKGKLTTRDMLRYQQAGVPILDELAKMYGKNTEQIRQMVTAGKVGFKDVEKMFVNMTSAGGRFANLMEKQSASITGRISNLQDAIDEMFNDIGEKTEGPINKVLELASNLVENYEKVGKAIGAVAVAYGVERAAMMVYIAIKNRATAATAMSTRAKIAEAAASNGAAGAQMALNKAILANPYVLAATAVAALTFQLYRLTSQTSEAEKAQGQMQNAQMLVAKEAMKERTQLDELKGRLEGTTQGTKAWNDAKNEIVSKFGKYHKGLDDEITKVGTLATTYDGLATSIENAARVRSYSAFVTSQSEAMEKEMSNALTAVQERLSKHFGEGQKDQAGSMFAQVIDYVTGTIPEMEKDVWDTLLKASKGGVLSPLLGKDLNTMVQNARKDQQQLKTLSADAKRWFNVSDDLLKQFETPTPPTSPDSPQSKTDKELTRQYNLQKRRDEQAKKLSREAAQAEIDAQQRQVDIMEDGYAKRRATNELNHKKEMLQIRNQREDKLKELQDEEKAQQMAENPDMKEHTFKTTIKELPAEWKGVYDQMEADALDKFVKANADAYDDMVKEFGDAKAKMLQLERDYDDQIEEAARLASEAGEGPAKEYYEALVEALRQQKALKIAKENSDMVSEYGNTTQKKDALGAFWKSQIEMAPDAIRAGMEEAYKKALAELDLEQFKTRINWTAVFGNLGEQGSRTIAETMGKVKQYLELNREDLGIDEIRDLEEALASMSAELSARNPFAAMSLALDEVKTSKNEALAALGEYNEALKAQQAAEQAYEQQKATLEERRNAGLITEAEYLAAVSEAGAGLTATQNNLTQATTKLFNAENNATTAAKKFLSNLGTARDEMRGVTSATSALVGVFDDELAGVLDDIMKTFSDLGDIALEVMEKFAQQGEGMIKSIQDVAEGTSNAVKGTAEATSAAISAAEAASVVLLVIKAVIIALTAVFRIVKANEDAERKAADAAHEYAQALREIADAANAAKFANIFGNDTLGRFRQAAQLIRDINSELKKSVNKAQDSALWWAPESLRKQLKDAAGDFGYFLEADMRSGWQKFWGTGSKNIVSKNLKDFIDKDGNIMTDALKAWYDQYGEYLSEGEKKLVDELISQGERFEQAMDDMQSYLEGIFGDTASSIADKMIDAFAQTGDAAADFEDIMSDVAKNIAKSWVVDKLIGTVFNKEAEQRMSDLISANNVSGAVAYYNSLIEKANESAPAINEFLRGLDVDWNPDERQAQTKSSLGASQDSVDESNARLTVIQGHTFLMSVDVSAIRAQNEMLTAQSAALLEHVQGIHINTNEMRAMMDDLRTMTGAIRSNVSTIVDRGVKMQ